MDKNNTIIVIPSRLESNRLPRKPLADINGKPMIIWVWEHAVRTGIAPVMVACDSMEISTVVERAGGQAVLTDPSLPSGSDRIHEALELFDPRKKYQTIINLQGDMPNVKMETITSCLKLMEDESVDIATVAYKMESKEEQQKPNNVKVAIGGLNDGEGMGLYFSRSLIPHGDTDIFCHVGLYVYKRTALERFVALQPSRLEIAEKLEQLRALENGMKIAVRVIDKAPLSVDTPEDLERARKEIK